MPNDVNGRAYLFLFVYVFMQGNDDTTQIRDVCLASIDNTMGYRAGMHNQNACCVLAKKKTTDINIMFMEIIVERDRFISFELVN